MNYKKINNITGWIVGIFACAVYLMTMEATISFWDCGEFASGAYKLEVVHAPGAPLFLLIGRLFSLVPMSDPNVMINALSALSSGFTILFLFWTITHFGKRIALINGKELEGDTTIAIMGAGVVGALAYCFSDTFWFSAVEAEVYAMSSFLTALVFWAILKWEDRLSDGDQRADRWIIFIAFILGLSIGVHLLNLLTIPAIVMVYYFKKFKVSSLGTAIAFGIGCILTGIMQVAVIQFIPYLGGKMDVVFVNNLKMSFHTGVYFLIFILVAICVALLFVAKKNNYYYLHIGALSFLFILIGYSTYFQTVIRSNADVPIDMNNPDNAVTLVSYLGREQYGSIPHLIGPDFTSRAVRYKEGGPDYRRVGSEYLNVGEKKTDLEYEDGSLRVFPRIWDSNDPNHVNFYRQYLGLGKDEKPSGGDNIRFFMSYQVNQMWWRYFCWNYIGRQNDFQNIMGEPENGNWLSGIKPIDKLFGMGDVDQGPAELKNNKARNELYFLPFILGIVGLIYQLKKDKRNTFVVGLLYFFTGLAIVIYLNNTPIQPRERDYAYAGATYAFAIWIGLGLLSVRDFFQKILKGGTGTYAAIGLCLLAVPVLMAFKNWDDHDRSDKTLALDSAKNYLESLDKNAILFTEGDNDTYPLWNAQEVLHVRPDVRIINLSLLGIDWYIDQLNVAINDAGHVPMVWKPETYRGEKLNYVQYQSVNSVDQSQYFNLQDVLMAIDKSQSSLGAGIIPVKNFSIPIDKEAIRKNNILNGRDSLLESCGDKVLFTYPRDIAYKNDLAILSILAANKWQRPVYFANSIDQNHYEGLGEYLEMDGLAFKLVPYRTPNSAPITPLAMNTNKCFDWIMNKVKFGHAEKGTVYYDQTNRRMLNGLRIASYHIAENLIREGRKEDAIKVLDHMMKNIHEKSYPIGISQEDKAMILIADSYMKAGATKQAEKLCGTLAKYSSDMLKYYNSLSSGNQAMIAGDLDFCRTALGYLMNTSNAANMKNVTDSMKGAFDAINNKLLPQGMQ